MIKRKTKRSVQKVALTGFIIFSLYTILETQLLAPTREWIGFSLQPKTTVIHAKEEVVPPSPTPDTKYEELIEVVEEAETMEVYTPNEYDILVSKYADKYGRTYGEQSRLRATLHCLLNKESTHGSRNDHGDNGMAGGPMQFWEETYIRMRGQMIKDGIVKEMGTRYDLEKAIETTAWAVTNGKGKEWGPVLRSECLDLQS